MQDICNIRILPNVTVKLQVQLKVFVRKLESSIIVLSLDFQQLTGKAM